MTWFGSGKDQIKYYVQANQAAVLDAGSDNGWIFIYYIKKKRCGVFTAYTNLFSPLASFHFLCFDVLEQKGRQCSPQ